MTLALRFLRALWLVGLIFCSYMLQLGLGRLLGTKRVDPETGTRRRVLPAWLQRRRERVDTRNAERLLGGILRLRGVYVKLGQILSVLGGFLPAVYRHRLETLHDRVPPQPFEAMRVAFERSLGKRPEEVFASIESEPIAAASLGQVHVAYLDDGTKVAVKILYPRIREVIRLDLEVIDIALRLYKWFMPLGNLEVVHASLMDLLRRETDYVHEARCMERIGANFAEEDDILVPEVFHELTSKEVLTMTFMEGIKITRVDVLREAGIDPKTVAKRLVQSFYKQLFVDRFFHADPHPGNYLAQAGPTPDRPRLVILDFGSVTQARDELVEGMVEQVKGFFAQDGAQVLRGFERMGFVATGGNRQLLEETALLYFQRLLQVQDRSAGALMRASPEELRELMDPNLELDKLRELARAFIYPEGWFYIERAIVMMFGLAGQVDPDLDLLQLALPYVAPLLSEQSKRADSAPT